MSSQLWRPVSHRSGTIRPRITRFRLLTFCLAQDRHHSIPKFLIHPVQLIHLSWLSCSTSSFRLHRIFGIQLSIANVTMSCRQTWFGKKTFFQFRLSFLLLRKWNFNQSLDHPKTWMWSFGLLLLFLSRFRLRTRRPCVSLHKRRWILISKWGPSNCRSVRMYQNHHLNLASNISYRCRCILSPCVSFQCHLMHLKSFDSQPMHHLVLLMLLTIHSE